MIKLDSEFVTTVTRSLGGQSSETVTDTLFISNVQLDFQSNTLQATIRRGNLQSGAFGDTMDPVVVTVNGTGVFSSDDGTWAGSLPQAAALIEQLRETFDQFILLSGHVTGTQS